MLIRKNAKIEIALDKEGSLRHPQLICLERDDGEEQDVLIATDGKIVAALLARLDPDDVHGDVPGEALTMARKYAGKEEDLSVELREGCATVRGEGDEEGLEVTFSRCLPMTVPDILAIEEKMEGERLMVGLNAKLLYRLSQAIGCEQVILSVGDPSAIIRVLPGSGGREDVAFAAIMPVRLDSGRQEKDRPETDSAPEQEQPVDEPPADTKPPGKTWDDVK